jgi:hypothetical protein
VLAEPEESSVCHLAAISDPDGNRLYLHQRQDGTSPRMRSVPQSGFSRDIRKIDS